MIKIVNGDLLDATEKYIAHQCNSITTRASGIAAAIFNRFPYADVYSNREDRGYTDVPGSITICGSGIDKSGDGIDKSGDGIDKRYVINMFGQFYPGSPRYGSKDGKVAREKFFQSCLSQIESIHDLESIAFPEKIGCGMAGGDWNNYLKYITEFAERIKSLADVSIYRKL